MQHRELPTFLCSKQRTSLTISMQLALYSVERYFTIFETFFKSCKTHSRKMSLCHFYLKRCTILYRYLLTHMVFCYTTFTWQERDAYLPLAESGSTLFFVISDLAKLNNMYRFSLSTFLRLFQRSLETKQVKIQRSLLFSWNAGPGTLWDVIVQTLQWLLYDLFNQNCRNSWVLRCDRCFVTSSEYACLQENRKSRFPAVNRTQAQAVFMTLCSHV